MPTRAEIYFGSATGLNLTQKYWITDLLGFQGIMIGTGDINGDGKADMVMSTGGASVYVNYGKSTTANYSVTSLTTGTSTNGFMIQGSTTGTPDVFGQAKVVGDFNGDGLDDFVIGQTVMNLNGAASGGGYLIYGKTSSSTVYLTDLKVSEGFRIDGVLGGDKALTAVSGGGDVNGDGFADLIVSSPNALSGYGAQASGATAGGVDYIIYGGPSRINSLVFQVSNGDAIGTTGADTMTGTTGSNQLVGGLGNDTLIGGGGADVLYGGAGNDTIVANADNLAQLALAGSSQNVMRVDGGGGIDTFKLDGAGLMLDLSLVSGPAIQNIEKIDLTGSGNNTLKLSLTDMLQSFDNLNVFNSSNTTSGLAAKVTSNQLMVDGDTGDKVVLTDLASWTASGTNVVANGHTYTAYNHNTSAQQLLIDQLLTVSAT